MPAVLSTQRIWSLYVFRQEVGAFAARHAENMVEHYQDILESGEATDRQTTTLAQWEDKMDFFNSMIAFME